jgi:RNA polymerase sigma factor (TIGR02999 family)
MDPTANITGLLRAWRAGEANALDRLFPLVYDDMRRLAHARMAREAPGHTLDTAALVHEAFLRLVDQRGVQWVDRCQFLAVAAQVMRRVLIDYARRHQAAKRGGAPQRVSLTDAMPIADERSDTLLALDEALRELSAVDARLVLVVEYRFFGGLTEEETAQVLGVNVRTVRRDWTKARGWLHRELR